MPGNFCTIKEMRSDRFDWNKIPALKGTYAVVREQIGIPTFLPPDKGTGGRFGGKNPNVSLQILEDKWVNFKDDDERVLYIGQAGGGKSKETLRRRIKQYIKFGQKLPVAHWGGRFIWQLKDADILEIHWKVAESSLEDPLEVESNMLCDFKKEHKQQLPFANLIISKHFLKGNDKKYC